MEDPYVSLPKQRLVNPPNVSKGIPISSKTFVGDDFGQLGEAVLLHELVSSIASGGCLRVSKGGGNLFLNLSLPTLPKLNELNLKMMGTPSSEISYALKGAIFR